MPKILHGKIVSIKMRNTAVVEVTWKKPHPLYRKLLTRSKRFKADTGGRIYALHQEVRMTETKPSARDKHFTLLDEKGSTT